MSIFPGFRTAILGCFALAGASAWGQSVELLWPNGAPGAKDATSASKPSLTIYLADPKLSNGTSVVICPGGGYGHLATTKEGTQIAQWMNTLGVTGFVLQYRFSPYRHPIEMNDAKRAMRWVRANAKRFKLDPMRVGMVGFSAGGHLASTVATHSDAGDPSAADTIDRQSCKPLFQILGYPVITMMDPYVHAGSRTNLLGSNPSADLLTLLSSEKHVDANTPPAFLVDAKDDPTVSSQNSLMYYDSLVKAGVPAKLQMYDHGPHGFGLANGVDSTPNLPLLATWPSICATWMKSQGYLPVPTALREGPLDGAGTAETVVEARRNLVDILGRWTRTRPAGLEKLKRP